MSHKIVNNIDEKINIIFNHIENENWDLFSLDNEYLWDFMSRYFYLFSLPKYNKHMESFLIYFHHKINWETFGMYIYQCQFLKFCKISYKNIYEIPNCLNREKCGKRCNFDIYFHHKKKLYYMHMGLYIGNVILFDALYSAMIHKDFHEVINCI